MGARTKSRGGGSVSNPASVNSIQLRGVVMGPAQSTSENPSVAALLHLPGDLMC